MGFPACVIRRNNHLAALSAIAAAPERPAFPTVVDCPHCRQNTLHLFDDLFTDGIWLNCTECGAHGDIITFGSSLWNISLPETIAKFSDLKAVPSDDVERLIVEYSRFYPKQEAAETFILNAETQIWNHGDDVIACILRDLGVYHEIPACAGLIGVAHHEQTAKICATLGRSKPTRLRENGASIVFPFHDLPGRLVGFLLLQYNDRTETSQTFVPITGYKRKKPEAGYFLLHTAFTPPPAKFKNNQFISDDILWVLKAQCTYLKHEFKLLPLMASYSGREANSFGLSWTAFPPAQRIFAGVTNTPELVSRACSAKGYVAVVGPNVGNARRDPPVKRLHSRLIDIWQHAETWQSALTKVLNTQSELAAASFCERLSIPHDRLNKFLNECAHKFSDGFNDRVLAAVKTAIAAPVRATKKWIIIERDSGWWTHAGLQICNAKPTIKQVIQADSGERIYVGEVLMQGQVVEFSASANVIEKLGLLKYISTLLAPLGKFVVYDNHWNRRSHLLAMQLHLPELITVSSRLGWDEHANVFRLAKYEITHAGEIQYTPQIPGRQQNDIFPAPATAAPISIRALLTPANENAFVWATTAAIAANLLAPTAHKECVATALTPVNFDVAAGVGAALNCELNQLTNIQKNTIGLTLEKVLVKQQWPTFVLNLFNDTAFSRVVPQFHLRPLFVRMTAACATAAASYGWQVITPFKLDFTADLDPLKYVLPTYIQKCLQNRMQKFVGTVNIVDTVLADLNEWLLRTYDTTFNLAFARTLINQPTTAHDLLRLELRAAIQQNKIAVVPQPRKRKQPSNYFVRHATAWWLNRRAIDSHFHACKSTPINWLGILELLRQNNLILREEIIHNMLGVWVKASWGDMLLDRDLGAEQNRELG